MSLEAGEEEDFLAVAPSLQRFSASSRSLQLNLRMLMHWVAPHLPFEGCLMRSTQIYVRYFWFRIITAPEAGLGEPTHFSHQVRSDVTTSRLTVSTGCHHIHIVIRKDPLWNKQSPNWSLCTPFLFNQGVLFNLAIYPPKYFYAIRLGPGELKLDQTLWTL